MKIARICTLGGLDTHSLPIFDKKFQQ